MSGLTSMSDAAGPPCLIDEEGSCVWDDLSWMGEDSATGEVLTDFLDLLDR